jgi:hypothetical protein
MSTAATATATSDPRRRARNTQAGSSGPLEFLSIGALYGVQLVVASLLSRWPLPHSFPKQREVVLHWVGGVEQAQVGGEFLGGLPVYFVALQQA